MGDKHEDIDLTDEYLAFLLASDGLLSLERALIEEIISLRSDVESKSEIGHAASDSWREAHEEAQREIEAMRTALAQVWTRRAAARCAGLSASPPASSSV